jgi:hypothetical protein
MATKPPIHKLDNQWRWLCVGYETRCGRWLPENRISRLWRNVTCKDCLRRKIFNARTGRWLPAKAA